MKYAANILLLTIILFFTKVVHAQKKSFPGYYITTQGDTISGIFLNYTQWSKNPVRVEFVSNASSGILLLKPENCKQFNIVDHDVYISYAGPRLINAIDDGTVIREKDLISFKEQSADATGFMRLVAGNADFELYLLSDNVRANFFYKLPGQPITELRYLKYFDQSRVKDMPHYKQQINALFANEIQNKKLFALLEKLPYTEDGMRRFFERLLPGAAPKKIIKNAASGWIVAAGASINSVKVTGAKTLDPVGKNYGRTAAPLISIGYFLPMDRNFGRYFFYPQLKLSSHKNSGERRYSTVIRKTTFQSGLLAAELNGGLHILNKANLKAFVYAGGGMLALLNSKQLSEAVATSNNIVYAPPEARLLRLTYTINISAGISLKNRASLLAGYQFPSPIANYVHYHPMLSGIQIRVGYKMK